jgi:hypothetical protein
MKRCHTLGYFFRNSSSMEVTAHRAGARPWSEPSNIGRARPAIETRRKNPFSSSHTPVLPPSIVAEAYDEADLTKRFYLTMISPSGRLWGLITAKMCDRA